MNKTSCKLLAIRRAHRYPPKALEGNVVAAYAMQRFGDPCCISCAVPMRPSSNQVRPTHITPVLSRLLHATKGWMRQGWHRTRAHDTGVSSDTLFLQRRASQPHGASHGISGQLHNLGAAPT